MKTISQHIFESTILLSFVLYFVGTEILIQLELAFQEIGEFHFDIGPEDIF